MKLTYRYTIHGFSGGMMLSNTTAGEWDFDAFDVGSELNGPNREVKITVLEKSNKTVSINIKYRKKENTLTISLKNEERFNEEANAYGFSYVFIVKE